MRSSSKIVIRLAIVSLCLFTANHSTIAAEFYKWIDENGNTVYSRTPPPGDVVTETVKTVAKADTEAAREAMQERIEHVDSLRKERVEKAETEQQAQEDLAFRQENCRRARTRLSSYSVPRGRIVMEDGSQIRPDEETRQQKINEAQQMVDEWCD